MDNKQTTKNQSATQPVAKLPVGCYIALGWAVIISCCAASIFAVLLATGSVKLDGANSSSRNETDNTTDSITADKNIEEKIVSSQNNQPLYFAIGCEYYVYGKTGTQLEKVSLRQLDDSNLKPENCEVISDNLLLQEKIVEKYKKPIPGTNNFSWHYALVSLESGSRRLLQIASNTNLRMITQPRIVNSEYRAYALVETTTVNWEEILLLRWTEEFTNPAKQQIAFSQNIPEGLRSEIKSMRTDYTGGNLIISRGEDEAEEIILFSGLKVVIEDDNPQTARLPIGTIIKGTTPAWLLPAFVPSNLKSPPDKFESSSTFAYFAPVGNDTQTNYQLAFYQVDSGEIRRSLALPTGYLPQNLTRMNANRLAYSLKSSDGKTQSYEILLDSQTVRQLGELEYAASYEGDIVGIVRLEGNDTELGKAAIVRKTGDKQTELLRF